MMPRQVQTEEEFLELVELASECRVKRLPDAVKLKLRTPSYLYTFKTDPGTAERIIAALKIPIVDV